MQTEKNNTPNFLGNFLKKATSSTSNGKLNIPQLIVIGVACLAVLLAPTYLSNYRLNLVITILTSAFFAQCWNLMSGYTGQFSFGHAAFFGLGAYTSSILYVDFGVNPWIGLVCGMAVAGIVAAIIGYLSFHYNLKGDYFALATMAFCEIFRVIFKNTDFLHGASGVSIKFSKDIGLMQFGSKAGFMYAAFVLLALLTFGMYKIRRTKMGLYFVAIRENEDAAKALGINAFKYKMIALIASAMFSAVAGTFYAQYYLYIDPNICFESAVSVSSITPCIIGGVGTVFGPIIGAAILEPISEFTNAALSNFVGLNMVVYGLILVVVIMVMPKGLIGLVQDLKVKFMKKKKDKKSKSPVEAEG
ncbi:MAG: branched-chain amino acid ABC transporter permease [Lachnospiraceae bacterium]|nr:branched-chain amino acid ABC transporter permease [Candidatus Merdinaster equi]